MTVKTAIDNLKADVKYWEGTSVSTEHLEIAIKILEQTRWIPCSERLPKKNEYVKDVCKYYFILDEYGDIHVAHLSNIGWEPIDASGIIENKIVAWMPWMPSLELDKAENEE